MLMCSLIVWRWLSTKVKSFFKIAYFTEIKIDIAKQFINERRFQEENILSQILKVSKRGKSWANNKVIHLKQQKKGSILSCYNLDQILGYIIYLNNLKYTISISLTSFSFPYIPFYDLSRSLMCSSITSLIALLNIKKHAAY